MQRTQQIVRRPSSNKVYTTTVNNYAPLDYHRGIIATDSRIVTSQRISSIPLNQVSAINFGTGPTQTITHYRSATKPTSIQQSPPNTKKIYFTYITPGTFQVQRRFVETVIRNPGTTYTNQWEQRYFQLEKQMHSFFQIHQKMALDFLKINDELKFNNQVSIRKSIQTMQRNMSLKDQQANQQNKIRYDQLLAKYDELKLQKSEAQKQANIFKQQNIKNQVFIEKLQQELFSQQKTVHSIQSQKNILIIQTKELQFLVKQSQKSNATMLSQKNKLQDEIYQLKMTIAKKNMEIQQLVQKNAKKQEEKNKSPQKNGQQKYEERLMKVKTDIERKQKKKFDKLNETKTKQIQQLSKYIIQLQEKERASRQLKQKYEKMYTQKKEEAANLKYLQQSEVLSADGEKQMYYEQKIQQLNKIAKQQGEKIKKLGEEKSKLQDKISQYSDNYVNQQHLAQLHELVDAQKTQLLAKGGVNYNQFENKATPYFNGKIFQQKLIYELKKDNQKMLNLLSKINLHQVIPPSQIIINQNMMINGQSGCDLSIVLKSMIADTFFKLQRIAQSIKNTMSFGSQAQIGSSGGQSPRTIKKQNSSSPKRKRRANHQENNYQLKISNDLQILKVYIVDLNETCDKLVKQLQKQQKTQSIISKKQKQVIEAERNLNGIIPKNEEIIQFHKEKNKQLQLRVDELLKLNSFLKQKLTERHPEQKSGFEYWKQETSKLKLEIEELTTRYNKLLAKFEESEDKRQNFESKSALCAMQIERLNKLLKQSQHKITTVNTTIKTVEQLTVVKVRIERQLSIVEHKNEELNKKLQQLLSSIRSRQSQILSLQTKLEEAYRNRANIQLQNNQLKSKISKFQMEINQYKIKIQSHNKTNTSHQAQLDSNRQALETQRKNYSQLQSQISQIRMKLQIETRNYTIIKNQNIQIKTKYETESKNRASLQLELNDLRNRMDVQINKSKLSLQNQINELRNKLQIQISSKSILQSELNDLKNKNQYQINSSLSAQSQLSQLRNKLQIQINAKLTLQTQITQIKRKYEQQVKSRMLLQTQMQERSKANTNQANQGGTGIDPYIIQKLRSMILESEVLTKQLSILVNNRNKDITYKLDTNYSQMLSIIANIYSLSASLATISSTSSTVSKSQISNYLSKIDSLQKRISEAKAINVYKIETIRSLFIQLECLVFEIKLMDSRDREIVARIKEHVGLGLQNVATVDLFDGY